MAPRYDVTMKEDLASSCLGVDTITRVKKKKDKDKIIRKIDEAIRLIEKIKSIKSINK